MKPEILKFYEDKGCKLTKLYNCKPFGLSNAQINAAADSLYREIQGGLEMKNINITRRIFKIAETINYDNYKKDQEILENNKQIINKLKDQRFWAYIIAFCSLFGFAVALGKLLGGF